MFNPSLSNFECVQPGIEVIIFFHRLIKFAEKKEFSCFRISDVPFILLKNVKMARKKHFSCSTQLIMKLIVLINACNC